MIRFTGSDWAELEIHLKSMIADDVEALKNPKLDITETQMYRGRIAAMEDLLDLPKRPEELKAMLP